MTAYLNIKAASKTIKYLWLERSEGAKYISYTNIWDEMHAQN